MDVLKERSAILRRRKKNDEVVNHEITKEEDDKETIMVDRYLGEVKKEIAKEKSKESVVRRK